MKQRLFVRSLVAALLVSSGAFAQEKKMASPPATAEGAIQGVKIKVNYHQPSARGRKIMGGLVPYGEVWRTGANETTSIEFSAPVTLEGKDLAAGKYALFTIPGENEWILIINKTISIGAYSYMESEDVLRVKSIPTKTEGFVETFTIGIPKDQLILRWENTQAAFKIAKGR